MEKKKYLIEDIMRTLFLLCGTVSVAFVVVISIYLIFSGTPAINKIGLIDFIFGKVWSAGSSQFGILPFILTSVYGTAGAVVLGVPVGIMTAVFLSKAAPKKFAFAVHSAVVLLAGIPSVVYGFFGLTCGNDGFGAFCAENLCAVIGSMPSFGNNRAYDNDTSLCD